MGCQGVTEAAVAQNPSASPLVTSGAFSRHASTYQLRPPPSLHTPFHAGLSATVRRLQLSELNHPEAALGLGAERRK